jgi:predicted RNA-binding protein
MCEANVFLVRNGAEEEIMRDVLVLENRGDDLYLADLLGNEKTVKAAIKHIDFGSHKVVLE